MSSTTPHTEMQFGPSWLKASSRPKSSKTSAAAAQQAAAAPAEPSAISYSAITRDHPTPLSPESGDGYGGGLDHIVDPSKPFRYSKEYMLGLYDEDKQKARELPFEFERWGVVFREEGGNPISLNPLTEMEKKLFALPYNPDRRAPNSSDPLHSGSRTNSSSDLHSRRNRSLAGAVGNLNLGDRASDRAERGDRSALNSPARERFGGITGGVLGGLAGGVGEGRLGGLSRERSDSRRTSGRGGPKEEVDPASVAPLPPSSTHSWRPTRTLTPNILPALPAPRAESPAPSEDSRARWRDAAPSASRDVTPRDSPRLEDSELGGGFGGAGGQRAGGWRERERVRTAETALGAAAGWENVGAAGATKQKPAGGAQAAAANGRQDYGNSFAALDQDEDDTDAPAPAAPAAVPQVSAYALALAAAEAQKEELKQVKWLYKDPTGNIQGPFPASSMQDWHAQGYFNASLLVRRETDLAFETVSTLDKLAPDASVIFLQPAPVRPAPPPGMISRSSTPGFASPIVPAAYASSPIQQHQETMTASRLAGADPLDRFLRQHEGKTTANPLGSAAGNDDPARWNEQQQQQSPSVQHQQPAYNQQPMYAQQPIGGAYDPTPLGYGTNSQAPRHLAYNAIGRQAPLQPGAFGQSPYSSPVVAHQAPSPWGQTPPQQQATPVRNFYGGLGEQIGSPSPSARVPYQYSPVPQLAPGAGWGANDWRTAGSPGPMPMQPNLMAQPPQQSYLNQLIPGSVQQHQQTAPWASSPSIEPAQPAAQQQVTQPEPADQQANQQAQPEEQQPAPASRWAQPLSHASAPSTAQPSPVEATPDQSAVKEQPTSAESVPQAVVAPEQAQPVASAPAPTPKAAALPAKPSQAQPVAPVVLGPVATEETRSATPTSAAKIAPWANEDKKATAGPSLREIQDAEARKVAAAKAARPAAPVKETSSEAPTSTSWGLVGSSANTAPVAAKAAAPAAGSPPVWQIGGAAPSRTLKQIQEEETKQKARAAQAKAAQIAAMGGNVAPKGAYSGAASSPGAANANAGGAWAVVGASGKTSAPAPTAAPAKSATTLPARPATQTAAKPTVPAVSAIQASTFAGKLSRSGSTASLDEISPSSEFVLWAKASLKSVTGVNIDEFLQMLLSFPLNPDPTVMEIISDSIYANSATLDGRRFAQEFCTKRKADAKGQKAGTIVSNPTGGAGRGSSLADIVKAQPKPAADAGFGGFKVVQKKKGGKK